MQTSAATRYGNQKSEIRFIRSVAAPKNNNHPQFHSASNILQSAHSIQQPSTIMISLYKGYNIHLNLLFSFNELTKVKEFIVYLKSKIQMDCVYFTSGNIFIDYFFLQQERKIVELPTNKLNISVHELKIQERVTLKTIEILKCIGSGGFSKVLLARVYGIMMAIKIIDKEFIFKTAKQSLIENEKTILQICENYPFITKLYFSFQTTKFIIFGMEYCNGGQLFHLLRKVKKMKEADAKFYFIETLMAIQYLHSKGILYRDLKPENILIDVDGHLRLADFGLSKIIGRNTTYSFCGSAQYISPQMLLKKGHSYQVDYYCLGALVYELVTGLPPFYTHDQLELFNSILNNQLTFPSHANISDELKSFLRRMLQKQPSNRFQSIDQILLDPWVAKDFDRQRILKKKLVPPYGASIFNYNFDDSDFYSIQSSVLDQIQKEANLDENHTSHFTDFYYESQAIIQLRKKNMVEIERNFIKRKTGYEKQVNGGNRKSLNKSTKTKQEFLNILTIERPMSIIEHNSFLMQKEKRNNNVKSLDHVKAVFSLHKQSIDKVPNIYTNNSKYWSPNLSSYKLNNKFYFKTLQSSIEKGNSSLSREKSIFNLSKQKCNSLDKGYGSYKKLSQHPARNYLANYREKFPHPKIKKSFKNMDKVNLHYGTVNRN